MRVSKLTEKDMTELREQDSPKEQVKMTRGSLRDYSGQHAVEVYWDLSEEAKKEMIFKLRIDDYEVLLDAEQTKRLLRWV
jgi:hypothetical protein